MGCRLLAVGTTTMEGGTVLDFTVQRCSKVKYSTTISWDCCSRVDGWRVVLVAQELPPSGLHEERGEEWRVRWEDEGDDDTTDYLSRSASRDLGLCSLLEITRG